MPRYRRQFTGSTYFFTAVSYRRRPIFCLPILRAALHQAVHSVRLTRPFVVDAWVLLPDHMHCIWTLPAGDQDYPTRWSEIKRDVASACRSTLHDPALLTNVGRHRKESTIWQRRLLEHRIRDERDMERYVDYIHFNPLKHGLVRRVGDWPFSTFHRYVRDGVCPGDWAGAPEIAELEWE
ncbi:REP-associated tyrosine transposase [Massilia sp. GCM10023247]|uniref:REP-associated tyrosine transposase n=1 Tax=Massilia sp. GCM10023247 TaxID=3252643 RepID=UPI00360E3501